MGKITIVEENPAATVRPQKPRADYRVYWINRRMGIPQFRASFASRADAKAYVAQQGGNSKDAWFKIDVLKNPRRVKAKRNPARKKPRSLVRPRNAKDYAIIGKTGEGKRYYWRGYGIFDTDKRDAKTFTSKIKAEKEREHLSAGTLPGRVGQQIPKEIHFLDIELL